MKIGELAKRSGLAASRIRFYEASGLIKAVERRANGYRDYGPQALWILEIITGAQRAGFSLEEIRHLLPVAPNAWQKDGLLDGLKRKVAEIEAMQQRLAHSKAQLLIAIDSIENRPEGMPCDDNTQRVLERLREESR
ncbi:MerR family transcriptional regulator [Pseudomonas sichuanensis]|uniref:MerR family transcriptional regulator n=1 Tax=Pseudomonas sichuanensis TaxID=2213015 RepID=UPI00244B4549|nr:MerR family transcriptional regulator [Pseudomonas sichuanensis]MDH0732397.1 MerR family transcriptional regulator [Pseudomonas sichuanensis]MDH1583871.1 MerR family transcriptional regulator [Pseudomonas sichuanensis]MDH1598235.1 MerR family transcriptional regulator [Pseudomonas sichuanensis]